MTNTASRNNKLKIVMIPVLGFLLLYAVMGGEDTTGPPAIELAGRPGAGSTVHRPSTGRRHSDRTVSWPERSLETIVGHNPFELTDARAILDAEFLKYGITEVPPMTVVDSTDFLEYFAERAGADGGSDLSAAGALKSAEHRRMEIAAESNVDIAAEARRARISDLQKRIKTLQDTPVTMIMTTDRGTSALLGERTIAEGEVLEDGIRAVSIGRDGVTFEIVDNPGTQ
ncbi:MAG: hypothetical protein GY903_06880 [Fuerstiella sp.]|nr:hypothetical protein [Fuerstiella sp.]MCP4854200.1 hypothetical protein [Fuerstiella sp.]